MVEATRAVEPTGPFHTDAAVEERGKLRRQFRRLDIFFFLLCTLVGIDVYGTIASSGGEAVVWVAVLALLFFVPFALLVAELGSSFPQEGGQYVWVKLAFGQRTAAVNTVVYWLSNPIWLGGLLTIISLATFESFFTPLSSVGGYVFGALFVWAAIASTVLNLRVGKWVPIVGAFARVALMGLFSVSAVVYAAQNGLDLPPAGDFVPTWAGFVGIVPILFFAFIGFEIPNAAGDEMEDPVHDVPAAIARAVGGVLVMYIVPVLLIFIVLGGTPESGLDGFIGAARQVLTVYGGSVSPEGVVTLTGLGSVLAWFVGASIILILLSSGTVWMMGADRSQAVAGFDGSAPRAFGRISARFGTPVTVNLASGVIATLTMVLAFVVADGSNQRYFDVVLGVILLFTILSYLVIFPAAWRLRTVQPDTPRPFRVPGGTAGLRTCVLLTTGFTVFAALAALFPGLLSGGQLLDDTALPEGFSRWEYQLIICVPILFAVLLGLAFYRLGRRTREAVTT